jgi:ADP-ribose pyrophosphatase
VLIEHGDSVAIVAVRDGLLAAVRQPRRGAAEPTLELPSGKVEPGETHEQAAVRELAEECGLAAEAVREVGRFLAVPAYSTERVWVYEATGLADGDGTAVLDDDEDLELEWVALDGAERVLSDGVSIAALALWRLA